MGMLDISRIYPVPFLATPIRQQKKTTIHTAPPNGSCVTDSHSSVKVRLHIPSSGQDKGWVCTSSRHRAQRAAHAGLQYSWHGQKYNVTAVWCTDTTHQRGLQPDLDLLMSAEAGLDWESLYQPAGTPSALCLPWIYGCFNTWLQASEPPSRAMPALLLVHTDTFTQGTLSSWLHSKVQGTITANGPTPVRTVGWHWHPILHIYKCI